jgi:hypothetical protein
MGQGLGVFQDPPWGPARPSETPPLRQHGRQKDKPRRYLQEYEVPVVPELGPPERPEVVGRVPGWPAGQRQP